MGTATLSEASRLKPASAAVMALRISGPGLPEQVVEIREARCTIGSGTDCTLRLAGAGIQPLHCMIIRGQQRNIIRRCAERAWLNNRPFDDAPLVCGDRLRVGDVTLEVLPVRLRLPAPRTPSKHETVAAAILPAPSSQPAAASVQPAPAASGSKPESKPRSPKGHRRLMRHLRQLEARLRQLTEEPSRPVAVTGRHDELVEQLKQERQELNQRIARWETEREQAASRLAAWTAQCDARDSRLTEREQSQRQDAIDATALAARNSELDMLVQRVQQQQFEIEAGRRELESAQAAAEARRQSDEQARQQTQAALAGESARLAALADQLTAQQQQWTAKEAELGVRRLELDRQQQTLEARRAEQGTESQIHDPAYADGELALKSEWEQLEAERALFRSQGDTLALARAALEAELSELARVREAFERDQHVWESERSQSLARLLDQEAECNRRTAELEARRDQTHQRELELSRLQIELQTQGEALAAKQAAWQQSCADQNERFGEREQALRQRESEHQERREALSRQMEEFQSRESAVSQRETLCQNQWQEHDRQMLERDAQLRAESESLQARRQQLEQEQAAFAAEQQASQQQLIEEQARLAAGQAGLQQQRAALAEAESRLQQIQAEGQDQQFELAAQLDELQRLRERLEAERTAYQLHAAPTHGQDSPAARDPQFDLLEQQQAQRATELAAATEQLAQQRAELEARQATLAQQLAELADSRAELERNRSRLEAEQAAREQNLSQQVRAQADSLTQLESLNKQLADERQALAARQAEFQAQCAEVTLARESQAAEMAAARAALDEEQQRLATERAALEQQAADYQRRAEQATVDDQSQAEFQQQLAELELDRKRLDDERRALDAEREELASARAECEQQQAALDEQRAELEQQAGELQRDRFDMKRREAEDYAAVDQRTPVQSPREAEVRRFSAPAEPVQKNEPAEQPAPSATSAKSGGGHRVELSSVALLRRLGAMPDFDDEHDSPGASVPPPVQQHVAPQPAPQAAESNEDEDDIKAYMQRLMARNGGSSSRPPEPQATSYNVAPTSPRQPAVEQPKQPVVEKPAEPGDLAPRSLPPELSANLSAMRELANANARMAIQTHARRTTASTSRGQATLCAVGLTGTVVAGWMYTTGNEWALYVAAGTGLLTVGLVLQNLKSVAKLWHSRKDLHAHHHAIANVEVGSAVAETMTTEAPADEVPSDEPPESNAPLE
ncbi:MAG TPA: hypothetical protein VHV55_09495 [Pirellulales bacterium]|nr:hypothetical protein [Pirellulales bacterium]